MTVSNIDRRTLVPTVAITRRQLLAGGSALAAVLALGDAHAGAGLAQEGEIAFANGPEDLILQVKTEGGFGLAQNFVVLLPDFSLFGDGLVVTLGPTTLQFPGPALPNLRARRLNPEGIQAVLAAADRAGLLDDDIFLRVDQIADAGTTTFTTTANDETTVVSAYALGPDVPPGVTGAVAEIYRRLAEFQALLGTLEDWLPAGAVVESDTAFEITRLQVVAIPTANLQFPLEPAGPPATWPLDSPLGAVGLPLAETDASVGTRPEYGEARCAVFEGDAATTLVAAFSAANAQTAWESDGTTYALFPQPLLPHESGCGAPISDGATPAATPET